MNKLIALKCERSCNAEKSEVRLEFDTKNQADYFLGAVKNLRVVGRFCEYAILFAVDIDASSAHYLTIDDAVVTIPASLEVKLMRGVKRTGLYEIIVN